MSYRDFSNEMKSKQIKRLYLLYGKENYLLDRAKELLQSNVVTVFPELNLTVLDGEALTLEKLQNTCETFPFGSEKKLVIVRQPMFLKKSSGKNQADSEDEENTEQEVTSRNDQDQKKYLELLQELPETCCLLLLYYGELGKSKKLFDAVNKAGLAFEFKKVDRDELSRWVKNSFGRYRKQLSFKEIDYFINMTGYLDKNSEKTLYDLENEVDKIAAYAGPSEEITLGHIDSVMPRNLENDIFKLINSCADKRPAEGLSVLSDLLVQGEEIFAILSMITKQIRTMIAVLELNQKGLDPKSAAARIKIHEFYAKNCLSYGKKIGMKGLVNGLNNCISSEANVKTGRMDKRLAMEMLMINMFQ